MQSRNRLLPGLLAIPTAIWLGPFALADGQVASFGTGFAQPPRSLNLGYSAIGSGSFHGVASMTDGTTRCWGANSAGQSNVPVSVGPVTAVAGGEAHSLAIKLSGEVVCWGFNSNGQCAVPASLGPARAVAGGKFHSMAINAQQTVVCWGSNARGQCSVPATLGTVSTIAAGSEHSLAIKTNGTVRAWGSNGAGESTVPGDVGTAIAIAGGSEFSLAVRSNGTVRAWGQTFFGSFVPPAGLSGVSRVSAGFLHAMALRNNGSVTTWSAFPDASFNTPTGLAGVVGIAAGMLHCIALKADGTVVCWGPDPFGVASAQQSIGIVERTAAGFVHGAAARADGTVATWGGGVNNESVVPTTLGAVVDIESGRQHSMALRSNGTVVCWGSNESGICLGTDFSGQPIDLEIDPNDPEWGTPVKIQGSQLSGVAQISAGAFHSAARRTNGTFACWGNNDHGQCTIPFGLATVVDVAAGGDEDSSHTLAVRLDGTVVGWGGNLDETGAIAGQATPPSNLASVLKVSAGGYHSMALRSDGTVRCWGSNNGPASEGPTGQSTVPAGLSGVAAISAGAFHSVALKTDGRVTAWGSNLFGESAVPAALSGVTDLEAGYGITLAVLSQSASSCANPSGAGIATVAINGSSWQDVSTWSWSGGGAPQVPGAQTDAKFGAFGSVAVRCGARAKTLETRSGSTLLVPVDFSDAGAVEHEIEVTATASMAGRVWLLGTGAAALPADLDIPILSTPSPLGIFDIVQTSLPAPPGKFLTIMPTAGLGGATTFSLRLLDLPNGGGLEDSGGTGFTGAAIAAETMDVNGDGFDDLALAIDFGAGQPGRLQVLVNDGAGSLGGASILRGVPGRPLSLATGDANGDGRDDVVIGFGTSARLFLGGGSGVGTLTESTLFQNLGGNAVSAAIVPGDAVGLAGGPGTVVVGTPNTSGIGGTVTFFAASSAASGQSVGVQSTPRAMGRRGRIIATGGTSTANVGGRSHLLGAESEGVLQILAPNAADLYEVVQTIPVPASPRLLDLADIDGDGFEDILSANDNPTPLGAGTALPVLTLFRGSATVFGDAVPIAPAGTFAGLDVTLIKVNGDEIRDIVAVCRAADGGSTASVIPLLGSTGGPLTLGPEESLDSQAPILSARGVLDADSSEDLFLVDQTASALAGGGSGVARTFQSPSICIGDLNGSGLVEGGDLTVLLVAWAAGTGGAADLTGDGLVDGADLTVLLLAWGGCGSVQPPN